VPAIRATPANEPITIPAMTPPESVVADWDTDAWTVGFAVGLDEGTEVGLDVGIGVGCEDGRTLGAGVG
jgi:hypothetical protein